MDAADYDRLREEIIAEYKSVFASIRRERNRRLKALRVALGVPPKSPGKDPQPATDLGRPFTDWPGGRVSRAIYLAIKKIAPKAFTWQDIQDNMVPHKYTGPAIRTVLRKLVELGIIDVTLAGAGRRPTWYRVKAKTQQEEIVETWG